MSSTGCLGLATRLQRSLGNRGCTLAAKAMVLWKVIPRRRALSGGEAAQSLTGQGQLCLTVQRICIAWNLIEPAPDWIELVKQLPIGTTVDPASISFDAVKARVGNVVHNIQLSTRATSGRRGGGILGLG